MHAEYYLRASAVIYCSDSKRVSIMDQVHASSVAGSITYALCEPTRANVFNDWDEIYLSKFVIDLFLFVSFFYLLLSFFALFLLQVEEVKRLTKEELKKSFLLCAYKQIQLIRWIAVFTFRQKTLLSLPIFAFFVVI